MSTFCFDGLGGGVVGRKDGGSRLFGEYRLGGALLALAIAHVLCRWRNTYYIRKADLSLSDELVGRDVEGDLE